MPMDNAPPPAPNRPASDWGGWVVRFAAWLLVFACVFAIFYGITGQPARKPLQPYLIPGEGIRPGPPAPAGSMPAQPEDDRLRYSV